MLENTREGREQEDGKVKVWIKQFSQMTLLLTGREGKSRKKRDSHHEKSQLKQPRFSLEGGRK